jgi:hypothetical protein
MKYKDAKVGDVHAPIEDTEVPLGLQLLTLVVISAAIALGVWMTNLMNATGLLNSPLFQ